MNNYEINIKAEELKQSWRVDNYFPLDITIMAFDKDVKTIQELNDIWIKMQNNERKRSLPTSKSFTEYYSKNISKRFKIYEHI